MSALSVAATYIDHEKKIIYKKLLNLPYDAVNNKLL